MEYNLSIIPGIAPAARHTLEDQLDEVLDRYGGEVTGGGTMMDGSESNLYLTCETSGFEDVLKLFLIENVVFDATITLKKAGVSGEAFSICAQQLGTSSE